MALSPAALNARGRIAALTRSREPQDPDLVAARADLKAARLEEAIARAVDSAPPLSVTQRARLMHLLATPATESAA